MKQVHIYTNESCYYCREAKDFLRQNNISFIEHSITKDASARRELMARGYRSVPLIIIDGKEISGFDKEKIIELLQL